MTSEKSTKAIFGERFGKLRANYEKKLTQQNLADELNVSKSMIGYYENGISIPDAEKLVEIAKFFNVSTDYLLGLSEIASVEADAQAACKYSGLSEGALISLREQYKESRQDFSELIQNPRFFLFFLRFYGMSKYHINEFKKAVDAAPDEKKEDLCAFYSMKLDFDAFHGQKEYFEIIEQLKNEFNDIQKEKVPHLFEAVEGLPF